MNSVETLSYQCRVVKTVEILVENDPAMPISELLNVLPFALLYLMEARHNDKQIRESAEECIRAMAAHELLPAWVA